MNIYTEAKAIAQEALEQTQYSRDDAEDFIAGMYQQLVLVEV